MNADQLDVHAYKMRRNRPMWTPIAPPRVADILQGAARYFGCEVVEITSRCHIRHVVAARAHCAQVLTNLGFSTTVIGRYLNCHHSSVVYMNQKARAVALLPPLDVPIPDLSGEWAI
jgi:hypothetical protein